MTVPKNVRKSIEMTRGQDGGVKNDSVGLITLSVTPGSESINVPESSPSELPILPLSL